jgi:hypothetical protein
VILENLGIAHVAAERVDTFMPAHAHHFKYRCAAFCGRREEARAQTVSGEQRGIKADVLGVRLDDIGDRLRGQPRADLAALPD